ncbi:MAG: hypothetical protein WC343_11840 [Bacilli bacterium]|jgi:hypothetical protein
MTHKIVYLTGDFPYKSTTTPFDASMKEIKRLLAKFGCTRVAEMTDYVEEMELTSIGFMHHGIPYRIDVPVIYVNRRNASNRVIKRQDNRIAGRIVVAHVKALLVDVELGLMDFQQAMVGHISLPAGEGQSVSLYDIAGHESFADWLSRAFRESEFSGPLLMAGGGPR